jgi:hypothetical protein
MAHPERAGDVHRLEHALDAPVGIHWDREGPASGNADRVWRQARATWEMHDPAADWHVLIQDDAIVCADLLAGLSRALEYVPAEAVVSCYLGAGRHVPRRWEGLAARATEQGAAWVRAEKLMWGVCIAVPVPMISGMLEWCDTRGGIPDDMRVAGYFARSGLDTWYTWPSLVDHAEILSLTKHRAPGRVARKHHKGSALDVNWAGPVMTDPMLTIKRGPRSAPRRARPVR